MPTSKKVPFKKATAAKCAVPKNVTESCSCCCGCCGSDGRGFNDSIMVIVFGSLVVALSFFLLGSMI